MRVAAIDCGTNSMRLLVADVDPMAGRSPTWTAGWRSSGSARGWTPPGGSPRRRWPGPWGRCGLCGDRGGPARPGADGGDQRHPGRRERGRLRDGVRGCSGSARRSSAATRRPCCRSPARPASCRGGPPGRGWRARHGRAGAPAVPGRRHRRRLHRVRARGPARGGRGRLGGHRLRPDDRAAPARRSADAGRGRGRAGRYRRRARRGGGQDRGR